YCTCHDITKRPSQGPCVISLWCGLHGGCLRWYNRLCCCCHLRKCRRRQKK
ncbi:hypothetical protein BaRGS_00029156, partial [Batillaria attramentaria]